MSEQSDLLRCYDALRIVVRKMCDGYDNATGVSLLRMDEPSPDQPIYVYLTFDSIELDDKDKTFILLVEQVVANTTDRHTIVVAYSNPRYFENGGESS